MVAEVFSNLTDSVNPFASPEPGAASPRPGARDSGGLRQELSADPAMAPTSPQTRWGWGPPPRLAAASANQRSALSRHYGLTAASPNQRGVRAFPAPRPSRGSPRRWWLPGVARQRGQAASGWRVHFRVRGGVTGSGAAAAPP